MSEPQTALVAAIAHITKLEAALTLIYNYASHEELIAKTVKGAMKGRV